VNAWGNRNFTEDELISGQTETLMLLAENKNPGLFTVLNQLHHHISPKLLKSLISRVSRTKFGPEALDIIMKSQSFKGLYYEKVKNTGLVEHSGSFSQFFTEYLSSAVSSSVACATAVLNNLC
jgi:hypothetical protein